jgi:predicted acylesterase/phospholipase RssA
LVLGGVAIAPQVRPDPGLGATAAAKRSGPGCPAVKLGNDWYGDGGVRLHTPLSPAIHLGARRILAISTRYQPTHEEADRPAVRGYPAPAQVAGILLDAIFLDLISEIADAGRREPTEFCATHSYRRREIP